MKLINKTTIGWLVVAIAGFLVLQLAVTTGIISAYYEITLVTILINIILAVGLNLIIGFSGQFSLGHAGFMAMGAYTAGIITKYFPTYTGLFLGILASVVLTSIVALIVGIPTLRLKGDYLAIATLGVAEIIRIVIVNMQSVTNGAAGLSGIPYLSKWPLIYVFTVLTILLVANYTQSSPGRATIAIREDEIAAESMGVNTTKYKTIAFILGAATAAIGGALHASYFSVIRPGDFTFNKSVDVLIIVVFGGIGSITGSVVAAILLGFLNVFLQPFGALRMIIYALALIGIMIFKPSGLLGNKEFTVSGLLRLFNRKSAQGEG
ncbi:branched-chain amino acid ABC transporter permease [Desemzia incerta]|uniref:branched-chain amino acid ABC transporter permease n=1 Tax=Desemzia incerta TaxID=82801 RepID=UPI0024C406A3|nr:branched-chain amino acid ABC transporter permease [Desemzia incerta]WHZ32072.1 branched-chain amino acid ABC transporter permease [Desemzia incerta]